MMLPQARLSIAAIDTTRRIQILTLYRLRSGGCSAMALKGFMGLAEGEVVGQANEVDLLVGILVNPAAIGVHVRTG